MEMIQVDPSHGKAMLSVLKDEKPWRRPIWMMRQAGRYLPEYRATRADAGSFLDLCYAPDLACEVTLQPLRRYDLDAAILFADILLIPQALGLDVRFVQNEGPVLERVDADFDLNRLDVSLKHAPLENVYETVRKVSSQLPRHVTMIGFCGAPWTVATYMIEGGTSRDRENTRKAAHSHAPWFDHLIDVLVETSVRYLIEQIRAGAEVVQIFDTWAGDLPEGLLQRYCFEPIRRIVEGVRQSFPDFPVIGFARGIGYGQASFRNATGVSAIGLDWAVPVDAMGELSLSGPVQGNLDPLALVEGGDGLGRAVSQITSSVSRERHIFNLGHGIRQETPPEHVSDLVRLVREDDEVC